MFSHFIPRSAAGNADTWRARINGKRRLVHGRLELSEQDRDSKIDYLFGINDLQDLWSNQRKAAAMSENSPFMTGKTVQSVILSIPRIRI
jgi:hypothetical protein